MNENSDIEDYHWDGYDSDKDKEYVPEKTPEKKCLR